MTKTNFIIPICQLRNTLLLFSDVDSDTFLAANITFDIDASKTDTEYYFVNQSGYRNLKNGTARLSNWVNNGDTLTVYVIGSTNRNALNSNFCLYISSCYGSIYRQKKQKKT